MDDLEIIDVKDMFDVDVISNDENEYNIVEDLIVDDEVYVSDTIAEDLPNLIEAGQFFIYIPLGSTTTKGIAKFDSKYFTVIDGIVYAKLTPKAIADKNGEDIVDTYQRKDNMIEQWVSEITEGTYPSAKLVKDSFDNIIYNKGKSVFIFNTEQDFLNWLSGKLLTDINGKKTTDLTVGDDIFMLDGSINYWCKQLNIPLTINDFMTYAKSIWGSITGDIQQQKDLIDLVNNFATKDFVNSSIETATATFKGTYTDLETLKGIIADKNDYAFYDHYIDKNRTFDRYKYDGTEWLYEYSLNNSSFTDAQWKAINSGATPELIDKILMIQSDISDLQGDVSTLNQQMSRTLKIPVSTPNKVKVVGVDETNSQILIDADSLGGGTTITIRSWDEW